MYELIFKLVKIENNKNVIQKTSEEWYVSVMYLCAYLTERNVYIRTFIKVPAPSV